MIALDMARKLLGGATGVLEVAAGLARHVVWYVSYRVDGTARTDDRRVGPEGGGQD
jgi:hypothetical protein